MQLHHLLKDRASINILKILYDNEFGESKKHTMHYSELCEKINVASESIYNLFSSGLINADDGQTDKIFSITQKGKQFIEQLDKLRDIMDGKKETPRAYQVQYSLTQLEQRILLLCSKMKSETGKPVQLKILTQEVYPYVDPASKSSSVSKYAKRLEELNLIKRIKESNRTMFEVTESGERAIKEQFMNAEMTH